MPCSLSSQLCGVNLCSVLGLQTVCLSQWVLELNCLGLTLFLLLVNRMNLSTLSNLPMPWEVTWNYPLQRFASKDGCCQFHPVLNTPAPLLWRSGVYSSTLLDLGWAVTASRFHLTTDYDCMRGPLSWPQSNHRTYEIIINISFCLF